MVWLDWVIIGVLTLAVFSGAKHGAVACVIRTIGIVISISECWRIAPWLRDNIVCRFDIHYDVAKIIALILAFVSLYLTIWCVGSWLASFFKGGLSGAINKILGAALGFIIAIYAMSYTFTLVDKLGPTPKALDKYDLRDVRLRSKLYKPIKESVLDLQGLKEYLTIKDKPISP